MAARIARIIAHPRMHHAAEVAYITHELAHARAGLLVAILATMLIVEIVDMFVSAH